ncbi:hypothetical protein VTN00DRAFT_3264 [Thermoascus crustaceus]|uniref:uncharacterized protein n=1 Tax=Thermoascus crustaceus TaxID=5088 RepID=UPI00374236FE
MNTIPETGSFWVNLRTFWPDEIINKWQKAVFTKKKTEVCENLIILSPSAHAYWTKALFALKPLDVAADGKSMDVQLFWLQPYKRLRFIPLVTRPELPDDLEGSVDNVKLLNHLTDQRLCSGNVITLRTNDPEKKPLPRKELLEMQWLLHRLTALRGGAEVISTYYDSDDDNNLDYVNVLDKIEELDQVEESTEMEEEAYLNQGMGPKAVEREMVRHASSTDDISILYFLP